MTALWPMESAWSFKRLVSDRDTYIMIDAIDECKDPEGLLQLLRELTLALNEDIDEHEPLHLKLCSRVDQPIQDYFHDCVTIPMSPAASEADQTFYIESEIDRMSKLKSGSLFFSSEKRYTDRLKKILIEKAEGLFRWTEIQIEKFMKRRREEGEIEDEFEWLESHTTHPEVNKESARLFDSKMPKLVSCCFIPEKKYQSCKIKRVILN